MVSKLLVIIWDLLHITFKLAITSIHVISEIMKQLIPLIIIVLIAIKSPLTEAMVSIKGKAIAYAGPKAAVGLSQIGFDITKICDGYRKIKENAFLAFIDMIIQSMRKKPSVIRKLCRIDRAMREGRPQDIVIG